MRDFFGDDGNASICFARAGSFDGRVEDKQIGLERGLISSFDDLCGAVQRDLDCVHGWFHRLNIDALVLAVVRI